jgi:hypothetical protein
MEGLTLDRAEKGGMGNQDLCRLFLGISGRIGLATLITVSPSLRPFNESRMTHLSKPTAILTGVAGEYFVAVELSRRGYIASISLRTTRGIDILATSQSGRRSITIQCKTSLRTTKKWMLNEKAETYEARITFTSSCVSET